MSDREHRVGEAVAWYYQAAEAGSPPNPAAFLARFPDLGAELTSFLADKNAFDRAAGPPPAHHDTATVPPSADRGGPAADPTLGAVRYFGDYELLAEIARGGMGVVFHARQVSLNREVALKMILTGQLASAADVARFRAEAEAAANLDHPSVLPIYEVGEHQGQQYFAMKLVPGGSLAGKVAEYVRDPKAAMAVFVKVCRAVDFAHRRGILHRDLKPGNILLDADGTPYVTDFGLAKKVDGDSNLTQSGAIVGTPSYMAPEQARAEKQLTTAADVYALGAILYELLTGRPPFRGPTVLDTILQVLEKDAADPRTVNPKADRDLSVVALKCLEKNPAKRYESAAALADDLDRWLRGEPILARPVTRVERAAKWVRRNPVVAALGALVLLSVVGGSSGFYVKYIEAKEQEAIARRKAKETEVALIDRDVALKQAQDDADAASKAKTLAEERERDTRNQLANSSVLLAQSAWNDNQIPLARERLEAVPAELRRWEWNYLTRQYQGGIFTLSGHLGGVTSVAFSPDGTRVATGSTDRTARLWDARTGQLLLEFKGHKYKVNAVAFNPDGTLLGTVSDDQTARIWDARSGHCLQELKGHEGEVFSVAFSSVGKELATSGFDNTVKIWDTQTGRPIREFKGKPGGLLMCVAFSPDGTRIATADRDRIGSRHGTVRLWDARSGRVLLECHPGMLGVYSVAVSPDGKQLATAGDNRSVVLLDATTGNVIRSFDGHSDFVGCVTFSPDGTLLATASQDQTARVWDVRSGRQLLECKGHDAGLGTGFINGTTSVAFSPCGTRLLTGSSDKTAKLWDARTGQPVLACKGHTSGISTLVYSPDGTKLATSSADKTARLWDARTGESLLELKGHTDVVLNVTFSRDGTKLATSSADKTARLWDARTGELIKECKGHEGPVSRVAFNADGTRLVTASNDKTARIWDGRTGELLRECKGHTEYVTSIAFSPDAELLATSSSDNSVRLWRGHSGEFIRECKGHTSGVLCVVFSPDGSRFATASVDNTARIWDGHTGEFVAACKGATAFPYRIAFSPDGSVLATANFDNTARIWDGHTGVLIAVCKGHKRQVQDVAWTPDGKRLVTSEGSSVRVWDAGTGQPLLECRGHDGIVGSVEFSPDGAQLATAGSSGFDITVRIWDARPHPLPPLEEVADRRRATQPEPEWHILRQKQLAAEGNSYGAAVHRSLERRARGHLAFEAGDFDRAWGHFIVAAALKPVPPRPPEIVTQPPTQTPGPPRKGP